MVTNRERAAYKEMEDKMAQLLSVHIDSPASQDEATPGCPGRAPCPAMFSGKDLTWLKTWRDFESGRIYCWWGAPDKEALEDFFQSNDIPWEEIAEVKFTSPRDWAWRED